MRLSWLTQEKLNTTSDITMDSKKDLHFIDLIILRVVLFIRIRNVWTSEFNLY